MIKSIGHRFLLLTTIKNHFIIVEYYQGEENETKERQQGYILVTFALNIEDLKKGKEKTCV